MEGQALHFRWGDGSKFICEETKDCLVAGVIQKNLGKFRSVNRGACSDVKYLFVDEDEVCVCADYFLSLDIAMCAARPCGR